MRAPAAVCGKVQGTNLRACHHFVLKMNDSVVEEIEAALNHALAGVDARRPVVD
jgi:hypothetical protein